MVNNKLFNEATNWVQKMKYYKVQKTKQYKLIETDQKDFVTNFNYDYTQYLTVYQHNIQKVTLQTLRNEK